MVKYSFILVLTLMLLGCGNSDIVGEENSELEEQVYGYWTLVDGKSYAINDKGEQITTATFKPNTVAQEFFEDGTAIAYDLTGSFPEEEYKWELKVIQKDSKDIGDGRLTLWNENTESQAGTLFYDDDGRLTYEIELSAKFSSTGNPRMFLKTKKFEVYPYKEAWVEYIYEKK